MVKGFIGSIEAKKISGWACHTKRKHPIGVTLYINGIRISGMHANEPRPTIANDHNLANHFCGFCFDLNAPITNRDEIVIKAGPSQYQLRLHGNAQRELEALIVDEQASYLGELDIIGPKKITGWAYFEGSFYKPSTLDILVNNIKIASIQTNQIREDVIESKGHPTGKCGFVFAFEKPLTTNDTVAVVFANTNQNIKNSPGKIQYTGADHKKVLIIGSPKTGTSILTYRIADALPFKPELYFELGGDQTLNYVEIHRKKLNDIFVVTKSIFFPVQSRKDCNKICELYDRVVWIVRDPRDQFISNFFYMWYHIHKPNPQLFELAYKRTKDKENNPTSIPFHKLHENILDANQYFEHTYGESQKEISNLKKEIFVLKYEDFVDNKLTELNQYLGLEINPNVEVPKGLNRVVRTKKYGNWRNWFTPEDIPFYKPILEPYLRFFGYDVEDWRLNNPGQLNSKEGSEYMLQRFKPTK